MSDDNVIDARIAELQARIVVCQIDVEAMKAENMVRQQKGEAMAYDEHAFDEESKEVEQIANTLREMGQG